MFVIVEIGGFQEWVREGDRLQVPLISGEEGKTITFDNVLLSVDDNGEVQVGTPHVSGMKVEVKILGHGKGDKIRVFKMKRRKRYRRVYGHRQDYTEIEVLKVEGGKNSASSGSAKTTPQQKVKKEETTEKKEVKKETKEKTTKKKVKKEE